MNKRLMTGFGVLAISIPYCQAQSSVLKPNVVIIYADDIGYGDINCNGSETIHTPNVDKVAASGVRFTNAHSVAATSTPSRYSLLTGEYAWRKPNTGIATGDAPMIIKAGTYTLAALFQNTGYKTAAVGKWHLGLGENGQQDWNGYMTPGPKDIGFDYSFIMAATGDRVPCVYMENQRIINLDTNDPIEVSYAKPFEGELLGYTHPELLTLHPSHGHNQAIVNGVSRIGYMKGGKSALWKDEEIADRITEKAVAFIENNKDTPFFLYFGTNDIHVPRVPHPRFAGKSGMGARGDAILQFDWTVGQIVETLEKNNLTENTILIITSDNGPVVDDGYKDKAEELLGEHKPWGRYRGGKYSAFEAGTRVPCIVSWPERIKKGVSDALLSQVDMLASFAGLLNADIPNGSAPDSLNQWEAWTGKNKKGREYVIEQSLTGTLSVLAGEWKYIEPNNSGWVFNEQTKTELGNDPNPQLYNVKKDSGERKNLAEKYPEKTNELSSLLRKIVEK
ncbi:sulfatase family protein [Dysgonomonas reticulitermitis]